MVLLCGIALVSTAAWWGAAAQAKESTSSSATPTASQIVAKNVEARGGLEAWRKVQTMVWAGHLERANTPGPSVAFVLEQKRPNKTRFEIKAMDKRTLRVFDGSHGWKARQAPGGGLDLAPYTIPELKYAREAQTIDGPLIDYADKRSTVTLQGVEQIEGRKAYRLAVQFASGEHQDVWIDAQSFLDIRIDRMSFGPGGASMVPVYYRNFKSFDGLQIPMTIEIGVGRAGTPDKMQIERVTLNPPLEDRLFAKPGQEQRRDPAASHAVRSLPIGPNQSAASPDAGSK